MTFVTHEKYIQEWAEKMVEVNALLSLPRLRRD
jgi:hypothetical protein